MRLKTLTVMGRLLDDQIEFARALVVGQIALALILLTGAGLVVKSFWRLQADRFRNEE